MCQNRVTCPPKPLSNTTTYEDTLKHTVGGEIRDWERR
jgi:hypothetical protein